MLRSFVAFLLAVALGAFAPSRPVAASPALGIDLGASGPVNPRGGEGHPGAADPNRPLEVAHDGHDDVHGTAQVNAVDPAAHKVNLSHQPIPQIGWPAMTMDFAVAPSVDLTSIKPGSRIDFGMEKGADGMYVIQSISAQPESGQPASTPPASNHRGH
jgi:Cu/Ag efflux protein CusF